MIVEVAAKSLRWRHIFYWPTRIIVLLFLLGYLIQAAVFTYLLYGPQSQAIEVEKKIWSTRRLALKNAKLANVKPYVWRQLLACSNLSKDKSYCLPTKFSFAPFLKERIDTYVSYGGGLSYYERPEAACLICHAKEQSKLVHWQIERKASKSYTLEKLSRPMLISVASWAAIFFIYLLLRLFLNLDLLAFALIVRQPSGLREKVHSQMGSFKRHWLYFEYGNNFIRGYISKRRLVRWLKKFFTDDSIFSQRDVSAITLLYKRKNLSKMSYEGLRIAQGFALKLKSGYLVLPEGLIKDEKMPLEKSDYRVVWKKQQKRMVLNGYFLRLK